MASEWLSMRRAIGHVASSLVLGGRRVAVNRPRVRGAEGHELKLPSWQEWSARDTPQQRAIEQMVLRVSTRAMRARWNRCRQQSRCGLSNSAVSERSDYGTEREVG